MNEKWRLNGCLLSRAITEISRWITKTKFKPRYPMRAFLLFIAISMEFLAFTSVRCQDRTFDLQQLLEEKKLITHGQNIIPLTDGEKKAISQTGIAWIKDVTFSEGTIEIDLRGRDVLQKSFIGIVFHATDTSEYDIVYFRPFNFLSTDPIRKIHAVQYATHPEFPWYRLRDEKNGIYEKAVTPAPSPRDWFHARIVVKGTDINVYVNNSPTPSLTVQKLNSRKTGKIGISNEGLEGEFANLVIRK